MKKSVKFNWVLIFLMLWSGTIFAQQKTVTGTVTSSEDNLGLPGVAVAVKGTTTGTITDFDGNFNITVDENVTLVFSFIGFENQEASVAGKTTLNIVLESSSIGLDEVVAVGYGSIKKSDLTGAVSSISSKTMAEQPSLRVEEALQGKVAGVQIQRQSGEPGGTMRVRIRGVNSLEGNNSPLYVIDGVLGADITSVSPNDIQSIEVLKDASATAIYGSRGSNGVILVTTKTAKVGQTTWSLNAKYGVDKLIKDIGKATPVEFMNNLNTAYANYGLEELYSAADIAEYENDPSKGTIWQDLMWQDGVTQDYQLSAAGGSEKINYYVSGTYSDVEGIIKNYGYTRYGMRSNIDAKFNDNIKISFNLNATRSERDKSGANVRGTYSYSPLPEAYDEFGEYTLPPSVGVSTVANPAYSINDDLTKTITNRLSAMTKLEAKLMPGLTYSFTGAAETFMANSSRFKRYEPGLAPSSSEAKITDTQYLMWQVTNQLNYFKDFGDHALTLTAVQEVQEVDKSSNSISATGFVSNSLEYKNLSLAENTIVSTNIDNNNGNTLSSFLGRVNYNYLDKYLFTASMRADASSKFAEGNKWAYFPSAALAWRVSEENFFPELSFLDAAKLRVSYGEVGSQAIKPYQTLASLFTPTVGVPMVDGSLEVPILLGDPANSDLKWETTAQIDGGLDVNMFGGRLNVNADYYYKKTSDLLYAVTVPMYAGTLSGVQIQNIGSMENKGFELLIDAVAIDKGDFSLNVAFNISTNKNTFLGIDGIDDDILVTSEQYDANQMGGIVPFFLRKGEPLANIRGLEYLGPYKTEEADLAASYGYEPGAPKYKDQLTVDTDGDGVADASDGIINADDAVVIGNGAPDYTWGLNLSAEYKSFDFSMFVQGVQGIDQLNTFKFGVSRYWTYKGLNDAWSPTNNDAYQWAHVGDAFLQNGNTQYLEDASFVRLKNITVGYTLPKKTVSKIGLNYVRFYMNAQNLLTLTDYSWFDPESSSTGDSDLSQGVNQNAYPNPKSINFGVNVKF